LKLILIFILSCFAGLHMYAQPSQMQRDYKIPAGKNLQQLDTLSIVAESFIIKGPEGKVLDQAFYNIDFITARLRLRIPEFWMADSLHVSYRVWPVNFASPVFAKDTSLIRVPGPGEDPVLFTIQKSQPEHGLLRFDGLQSSGSITRGITVGNRQDITLNSAMNLQLSGRLTDDIDILAVISDRNIPIQPEGTTQQIQDFDKVFIQLSGHGASLIAGDFELEKPPGYFMNYSRKVRGASISYESQQSDTTVVGRGRIRSTGAGAISRGKYARNIIPGREGNQGPYKLTGNDNESFIMVLAGSERVFLDGRLLSRGMDNDYVIDYNMAEVRFMPSRMITRDSRIVVEFEYAERNYARSMIFSGTEFLYEKASFRLNFYSEQDHRNQSLFQELSPERKALMASVGDSVHRAFDWNIDQSGFRNDRVMYRLTDTLGFDSVFVFSTDPEWAHYQLGFTFMGAGNGNYRQISSAANGRVFQWVAPQNGIRQGTHEPIVLLVTPKSHQMLTLGADVQISQNTTADFEYALSNRDINLFSDLDKQDNTGHAFKVGITDIRSTSDEPHPRWKFTTRASYELSDMNFRPVERYRSVEFNRDWNLQGVDNVDTEHLPEFSLTVQHRQTALMRYRIRAFLKGEQYTGIMNGIENRLILGKNRFDYNGSFLHTQGIRNTGFYRHQTSYLRDLNRIMAGVNHLTENNRIYDGQTDTLTLNSRYFNEWEWYVRQPENATNQYRLFYKQRNDYLPLGQNFEDASTAQDYGIRYQFLKNPNQTVELQTIYRKLRVDRPRTPADEDSKTLNGRVDYNSRWADGMVTSGIFYEVTSGMEQKRDYIYVAVPPGQGVYVWNDYNENGIMELDEFELAPFPDEANFIRVFVPSQDMIPTYATSFSQSLNIDPMVKWREDTGLKGFAARFSNRLNYRIDKKNLGGITVENFNPFYGHVPDSVLITLNASFRNSLAFNRTNPKYSIEWTTQDNRNKNLLSNGFESREAKSQLLRSRWNFTRQYTLHLLLTQGQNTNESDFFTQRNYRILYQELGPSVSYQPGNNLRVSLSYGYLERENRMGDEYSYTHKAGLETRYSVPSKGNLQARYEIAQIHFPFAENTPIAFDILQGLRPGNNNLWSINWQHNLSNYLQLTLNYNGRKPPGVNAIHTGTVQLRALF
jgi:hypothetical protein